MKKKDKKNREVAEIRETKKELKKEKDIVLIILIIILILITISLIVIKVINGKTLDTDSKEIKELHNYFNTDDLNNCNGLFIYTDKKIEYKDLTADNAICLAYYKSDISSATEETYKPKKKETSCKVDDFTFKADEESNECNVTKIDKKIIDDTYKKLFGKEIENNGSFRIDNFNICYLNGDYYYCGLSDTFIYTMGNDSKIYRVINRAVEQKDEIIIYDYFAKINDDKCYTSYTSDKENKDCTKAYSDNKNVDFKFMKKNTTKYKHVFKKASDGSYYWVSSKPVK